MCCIRATAQPDGDTIVNVMTISFSAGRRYCLGQNESDTNAGTIAHGDRNIQEEDVSEDKGIDRPADELDATGFQGDGIRKVYDQDKEVWFFSVVDVIGILTEQSDVNGARNYWKVLKNRLKNEGSQVVTNCNRLKLTAQDGKKRLTDVADAETMLRIVQSVPSHKAEPVKLWLAKVGHERIKEMADPSIALDRSREYWKRQGRSEKWIE